MTHYHVKLRDLGSLIMGNFFMSMALIDKTRKKCSTSARWWGGPSGWGLTLCWATLFCHKSKLQTDKISSSKMVWWRITDYIKTKLFMGAFSLHQLQPKKESSAVLSQICLVVKFLGWSRYYLQNIQLTHTWDFGNCQFFPIYYESSKQQIISPFHLFNLRNIYLHYTLQANTCCIW